MRFVFKLIIMFLIVVFFKLMLSAGLRNPENTLLQVPESSTSKYAWKTFKTTSWVVSRLSNSIQWSPSMTPSMRNPPEIKNSVVADFPKSRILIMVVSKCKGVQYLNEITFIIRLNANCYKLFNCIVLEIVTPKYIRVFQPTVYNFFYEKLLNRLQKVYYH